MKPSSSRSNVKSLSKYCRVGTSLTRCDVNVSNGKPRSQDGCITQTSFQSTVSETIGVITATTAGYLSAKAGERREAALRQSEQEQRLREAEQRRRAETALGVAMESLEELFAQIESNRRPGQRLAPEEARGMLDALERMLAFYEQLAAQGQGGRQPEIRVAEALRRMGDLHRSLHEYDDAEAALLQAIASLEGLIEDMPDETEAHIQHARANYTLGRVYRDMGRRDEGDSLIQFAIAELEALPSHAPRRRHIQELLSRFRRDVRRAAGQ